MNIPISTPIRVVQLSKENEDDKLYILGLTKGVITDDFTTALNNGYDVSVYFEGVTEIEIPVTLLETDAIADDNGNRYLPCEVSF